VAVFIAEEGGRGETKMVVQAWEDQSVRDAAVDVDVVFDGLAAPTRSVSKPEP
jgi:hypothetical protein